MKQIEAKALLDCVLESPARTLRARAVLPFFCRDLRTKFLLVVPIEGRLLLTRDLPTGVVSRVLAYPREPRLRRLEKVSFARLRHFDPWWLVRDRKGVPQSTRNAITKINLAGKGVPEGPIENVWFDDGLAGVASARIGTARMPLRRLRPLLEAAPARS